MQRGADKLRARCFMKQHASRDARVPGSLAAQPRPASVAPSAGRDRAARVDPWPSGPDATRALGRTPQRPECRALGCASYMGAPLTDRRFLRAFIAHVILNTDRTRAMERMPSGTRHGRLSSTSQSRGLLYRVSAKNTVNSGGGAAVRAGSRVRPRETFDMGS